MQKAPIGVFARRASAALKKALGTVTGNERLAAEGADAQAELHSPDGRPRDRVRTPSSRPNVTTARSGGAMSAAAPRSAD